jgi:hypothetical protein
MKIKERELSTHKCLQKEKKNSTYHTSQNTPELLEWWLVRFGFFAMPQKRNKPKPQPNCALQNCKG